MQKTPTDKQKHAGLAIFCYFMALACFIGMWTMSYLSQGLVYLAAMLGGLFSVLGFIAQARGQLE